MKKLNMNTFKNGVKEKGPMIGIVGGVITLVASNVFTFFGTQKYVRKIDEVEEELGRETTPKEKIKYTWKYFMPSATTIITGTSAIATGSIFKSKHFKKEIAKNATALAVEKANFEDYKETVRDEVDKKTLKKVDEEYEKRQMERAEEMQPMKYDANVPMGEQVYCYDRTFGIRFIASPAEIKQAEATVLGTINSSPFGYADYITFISQFKILTRPLPEATAQVGWNVDKPISVEINGAVLIDGVPHLCIEHITAPERGYDKQI